MGNIRFVTYGITILLYIPAEIWYAWTMTNQEIADLLNQASYKVWDTAKVMKNQDYHDGVVKGLKMASNIVSNL